jgi:hypothetical protein
VVIARLNSALNIALAHTTVRRRLAVDGVDALPPHASGIRSRHRERAGQMVGYHSAIIKTPGVTAE